MTFEQLRDAIYPHVFKVVSTYKQDISIWNVYNEPVYLGEKVVDLTSKQTIEVIQKGASAIRDADPDASILVNIFNAGAEIKGPDPFEFVKEAVQTGVDFDIIGLELYYNAVMTERLNAHPRRTLKAQAELIDKYSAFGKKIIITEISVPSASVGKGYWDQSWSEDLQAEYLKSAYTLFFSRPQVQGITWWDIADGSWSFIYHGALINAQGKPKKSYYALKQLIKNWTTSGTAITNENGQINIRGFGGVYEVTMTDPRTGKSQKQEIEIQEQTQNTIRLVWNS